MGKYSKMKSIPECPERVIPKQGSLLFKGWFDVSDKDLYECKAVSSKIDFPTNVSSKISVTE